MQASMNFWRLAVAIGSTVAGLLSAKAEELRPPNLIYILADDLGYGDIGPYGQAWIATPHLDQLAREGIRFTDHYSGGPACASSRAAWMTGRHTGHTRVRGMGDHPLGLDEPSLARLLQERGYRTAVIGKWGLGRVGTSGEPLAQGFDEFLGFQTHAEAKTYHPEFLTGNRTRFSLPANQEGRRGRHVQDVFIDEALRFIERERDAPFLLFLAVTIPTYADLSAPDDLAAAYLARFSEASGADDDGSLARARASRAALISRLDHDVGRILARLDELNLSTRTLVCFSSDNGPVAANGHDPAFFESTGQLRGLKFSLWEGGIRVPFIARWSGSIPPGTVSDFVCATWDMLPTMAELLEVEAPDDIDGVSILPTLLGRTDAQAARPPLYWEHQGKQAIRRGEWKAIRPKFGATTELYDLREDPSETTNRAAENPELVAELEALMAASRTESELFPLKPR